MPLQLTLMRHAKSAWDDPGLDDHDRPLNKRGRRDAPRMAKWIADQGARPDLIIASTSRRTRETTAVVRDVLGGEGPVRFSKAVYLATPDALLAVVHKVPARVGHLMLVGHNPGMEQFALTLAGDGDPALRDDLATKFPTAAVAMLRFEVDSWSQVGPSLGTLAAFMVPKRLGED
jgi:phosphohistidine phosphatase